MISFGLSDIRKFLDTKADLNQIVEALVSLGIEVEKVIYRKDLEDFIVAEIIETKRHPKADNLQICKVNNGKEILDIVCGAPNARPHIKVVLASIGTNIPSGNFKIKASVIRDEPSNGMLCSAKELLISDEDAGIIELGSDAKVGACFMSYMGLDDPIIELSVTPNRSDCLSAIGIARDLAAKGLGEFIRPKKSNLKLSSDAPQMIVRIDKEDTSAKFATLQIRNTRNTASPLWLTQALGRMNVKPISLLVDIGNYVMHIFGQPLHIYDLDKVSEYLAVDFAHEGEKFIGLDNKEYNLVEKDIVVRDAKGIQALAGILGSASSGCDESTKNIVIEAAAFNKVNIAKTGRRLKIDSQARYRFDRGTDLNFIKSALSLAAQMVQDLVGGEIFAPNIIGQEQQPHTISLPIKLVEKRLGVHIANEKIVQILSGLGFVVSHKSELTIEAISPSWRHDVHIAEDLIEEIARIWGYNNIPPLALPNTKLNIRLLDSKSRQMFDAKRIMASIGYNEVVTWSFTNSKNIPLFCQPQDAAFIKNPLSSELNYMRPNILTNMLDVISVNTARSISNVEIFEIGPVFNFTDAAIEKCNWTAIKYGFKHYRSWQNGSVSYDFFDIKSDVKHLLAQFNINLDKCSLQTDAPQYYHPTQSATIRLGKNIIGYLGALHPKILKHYGLKEACYAFEIFDDKIPAGKLKYGKNSELKISNYPAVTKDLAFVVDNSINVGDVLNAVRNIDKDTITNVTLFDLYTGVEIGDNLKSIAFSYTMQSFNSTLTNDEIHAAMNKIIDFIVKNYKGVLRINC